MARIYSSLALCLILMLSSAAAGALPPLRIGIDMTGPDLVRPGFPPPTELPATASWSYQPGPDRFAADHIVVRFGPTVSAAMRRQITWSLGGLDYRPSSFSDFGRVDVPPGASAAALVWRFRSNPAVEWAERDGRVHLLARQAIAAAPEASATDDPFFADQWHLARTRQPDAEQINPTRGAGVIVAVLDTGVARDRADCGPGFPGFDLGGTQFVAGFDFVDRDNNAADRGSGDGNPGSPRFGHGTFTATVVAATADNQRFGTGVSPNVAIMPLRVLGQDGFGTFSGVAEAINFAVDNGADVINMSLGGSGFSNAVSQAVRRARTAGVVLVAAAGNDGEADDIDFPAADPDVIAVGATAFNDTLTSYSDRGTELDLVAPGGENPFDVVGPNDIRDAVLSTSFVFFPADGESACGGFWATGTSFATPQVAGAAALLKALGVQRPETIETLLQNGARDLGAMGFDNRTGFGLLDHFGAHRGFGFSFD